MTKILVIDDLIATGGTLKAARNVLEQGGATVSEFFGIVGLPELNYKEELLNNVILDINTKIPGALKQYSYYTEEVPRNMS